MVHPFRRSATPQRAPQQPAFDAQDFDAEDAIEVSEGNDDADWAMWEDSVQQLDSGFADIDPFGRVGRRDR